MVFERHTLAAIVLLAASHTCAWAQPATGGIHGHVTDPSGKSIPNAAVSLTAAGRAAQAVKSDVQGQYQLRGVAAGRYTISVTAKGFAPAQLADYEIAAGQFQTLDFPLALASATEKVTVTDTLQLEVDPANNASALVIRGKELDALSDDRDDLAADLSALAGPAAGPNGGQIYVDGFTGGRLPPKSSIREIRINQNPFSAQYDRLGMGRVEIFTKPGSEDFHGELQFHYGNDIFNSRNPFTPDKPPYERRQYEGEVGGPLGKKTSFFADFEFRHVTENAFINARTLDSNLNVIAVSEGIVTPRRSTEENVKLDRQLSKNHTLTLRYTFARDSLDNQGAGGYSLATRIYNNRDSEDTIQGVETGIYGAHTVNETRARYSRLRSRQNGDASQYTTVVLDAFTGGGPPLTLSFTNQDRLEIQNMTTVTRGTHLLRWGARLRGVYLSDQDTQNYTGTFTFASLDTYRQTLLGRQAGLTPQQIRLSGGGASQFSIAAGNPLAGLHQFDTGLFLLDDWRARPNLTLSFGLRYEFQTNLSDHRDIAPRIGVAWGLGGGGKTPKTVIRAGAGLFYDRVSESLSLDALRRDGIHQQQFVTGSPDFYPVVPSLAQLLISRTPQAIRELDSAMRAPRMAQMGGGVERQLPKNMVVSVNYLRTQGWYSLRSRNITAPLTPLAAAGTAIYLYEASGLFKQNQLITSLNARISPKFSLTGSYIWNHANSDTDGAGTFAAAPYNLRPEYGRAGFDIRQRVQLNGVISPRWGVRLSPFLIATSGRPFNITTGRDLNGDTLFTDRPSFATDLNRPSVVRTSYGAFDILPVAGQTIIPRNYGQGPPQFALNLRVAKVFTLGEQKQGGRDPMELTLSGQARNLLNHPNLALPVGNLSSSVFGQSLALTGGGGGNSASGNRRIELQMKLSF